VRVVSSSGDGTGIGRGAAPVSPSTAPTSCSRRDAVSRSSHRHGDRSAPPARTLRPTRRARSNANSWSIPTPRALARVDILVNNARPDEVHHEVDRQWTDTNGTSWSRSTAELRWTSSSPNDQPKIRHLDVYVQGTWSPRTRCNAFS